ncbi:Short-chain dehydrogenase/reductase [Pseudocercospora fuligena]|uniref:Short-chain dehydrogenase/reductase n=1 Tax=Pseudocercospora fuligena TaxID=685502 RepID=A0A8H6RA50_9PEZI|nr:Short-chain dehydrogenase/reductase [Pseudocercospora fuligena]
MAATLSAILRQSLLIPGPAMTEEQLPDQRGKVHMITGGYSGIGYELAKMLYDRNATVFLAGRDISKAKRAIQQIRAEQKTKTLGKLHYVYLDLADLHTIKSSVEDFLCRTDRLDVLVNNAGVMVPPAGSCTKQGHELQMGVNCLGPFLLAQLLLPILSRCAASSPAGSVRIIWTGSVATELGRLAKLFSDEGKPAMIMDDQAQNYVLSKIGNIFLAAETARRYGESTGLVSVAVNPGNLDTRLQRNMTWWQYGVARLLLFPAFLGAYTQLYAGWSDDITIANNNGSYIWPWGRVGYLRKDLEEAVRPGSDGGSSLAAKFWSWCNETVSDYQ